MEVESTLLKARNKGETAAALALYRDSLKFIGEVFLIVVIVTVSELFCYSFMKFI